MDGWIITLGEISSTRMMRMKRRRMVLAECAAAVGKKRVCGRRES